VRDRDLVHKVDRLSKVMGERPPANAADDPIVQIHRDQAALPADLAAAHSAGK